MAISISIWVMAIIVFVSLMAGFWVGRSVKWMAEDTEMQLTDKEEIKRNQLHGYEIASPVSGEVRQLREGNRCGAFIRPDGGILYAPASGKIIRLFPVGNKMILRTDFGAELLLQVVDAAEELHSTYYRSRIIENEIVGKGKALLEFDMEGLREQGVDVLVVISIQAYADDTDVIITSKETIKVGEEIMWIQKHGE